jgi:hypothetical protein
MASLTYDLFRQALEQKKQITCIYHGLPREICPHTLGHTDGRERALTFQFGGSSSSGLPAAGEWRCMNLAEVKEAKIREGNWHSAPTHSKPQTCVKQVEYEVEYA